MNAQELSCPSTSAGKLRSKMNFSRNQTPRVLKWETLCIGLLPKGCSVAQELPSSGLVFGLSWPSDISLVHLPAQGWHFCSEGGWMAPRADLQLGSTIYSCSHDNLQRFFAYDFYPQVKRTRNSSSCFSLTKTQGILTLNVYFFLKHSYKSPHK